MSGTESKGNVHVPSTLIIHSEEEPDTLLLLHVLTNESGAEFPPADGSNVSKPSSCNKLSYWKGQAEEKDCSATYL